MGVYKGYIEFLWQHSLNEELKRVKAINYDSHTRRSDNVIVLKSREKLPRDEICTKTSVEKEDNEKRQRLQVTVFILR